MWARITSADERLVALEDIDQGERLRRVNDAFVVDLAVSIGEAGLIQPIVVRRILGSEKPFRLVVGAHRLAAHRVLGKPEIRARVVELSDLDAEQFEVDENIVRCDPGGWERCRFLGRRGTIYAKRHPDAVVTTGSEGPRGRGRPRNDLFYPEGKNSGWHIPVVMGFVSEVASETGLATKTLYRDAQIWAALHEYDAELQDLPVSKQPHELRKLAALPPEYRAAAIDALSDGRAESAAEAAVIAAGGTPAAKKQKAEASQLEVLKREWKKASPNTRRDFIAFLRTQPNVLAALHG